MEFEELGSGGDEHRGHSNLTTNIGILSGCWYGSNEVGKIINNLKLIKNIFYYMNNNDIARKQLLNIIV